MLVDSFGRTHNYLRISLTDTCNLRCFYCMPDEHFMAMPNAKLMQADEIDFIAKTFIELGVNKIRLTGGEPLVRHDAKEIITRLSKYDTELTLTTNGTRVDQFIESFRDAGIKSVNLSLDTLQSDKFKKITGRDQFQKVWDNLHLLVTEGFHVKLNVVAIDGVNEHELVDFVTLTKHLPIHVRFIEFMPFSGNNWMSGKVISLEHILAAIEPHCDFVPMQSELHETAKKFKPLNHEGTFAIISTMSQPFCSTCNRLRLTADGKMKNCLFSTGEVDLLGALRKGEDIHELIQDNVMAKKKERGGQIDGIMEDIDTEGLINRSMISIGG